MSITRRDVANKLIDYLRHRISGAELVDGAERVMMDGDFDETGYEMLRDIVARLGLADVRAFGLTWEECEDFLQRLGYRARIEVIEIT